jgi:hypothetical protein
MTRKGRIYGEIDVFHPVTDDEYRVHVYIDYVDEDDTEDTQGSIDWDYTIQWVDDEQGNAITDISWVTDKLIENELIDLIQIEL